MNNNEAPATPNRRPVGQFVIAFVYDSDGRAYRRNVEILEYLYGEGEDERYRVRNIYTEKVTVEIERDLR